MDADANILVVGINDGDAEDFQSPFYRGGKAATSRKRGSPR